MRDPTKETHHGCRTRHEDHRHRRRRASNDATTQGLKRTAQTVRGITGLQILSQKAKVENGKILEYRVTMEVTFVLE